MADSTFNPATAGLADQRTPSIRDVERELERIKATYANNRRWFLLGLLPRLVIGGSIVSAAGCIFSALSNSFGSNPANTSVADPNFTLLTCLLGLIVSAITYAVGVWGLRYCQARADGKL